MYKEHSDIITKNKPFPETADPYLLQRGYELSNKHSVWFPKYKESLAKQLDYGGTSRIPAAIGNVVDKALEYVPNDPNNVSYTGAPDPYSKLSAAIVNYAKLQRPTVKDRFEFINKYSVPIHEHNKTEIVKPWYDLNHPRYATMLDRVAKQKQYQDKVRYAQTLKPNIEKQSFAQKIARIFQKRD